MQSNFDFSPETIKEGDIVFISPIFKRFYLYGDISSSRVGFQSCNKNNDSPLNFDDCLWRIIPQLSYQQATQLKKMSKQRNPNIQDTVDLKREKMLLEEAAFRETKLNRQKIKNVEHGEGKYVKYGQVTQLMHLKTGKFLVSKKQSALIERRALSLKLEHNGSNAAGFMIKPSIKVKAEGAQVYYKDSVQLVSVKAEDYGINCSKEPYCKEDPEPRIHEANIQVDGPLLKIFHFASFKKSSLSKLRVAQAVRLYHYEAESYLEAPPTTELPTSEALFYHDKGTSYKASYPYLQQVLRAEDESAAAFSGKSAWMFERKTRNKGGEVQWDTIVRVRNMASGQYLAVVYPEILEATTPTKKASLLNMLDRNSSNKDQTLLAADTREYLNVIMVSDDDVLSEKGNITFEQTLFVLKQVDPSEDSAVPLGCNFWLQHEVPGERAADSTKYYLSWSGNILNGKDLGVAASITSLRFLKDRRDKDALQIQQVSAQHVKFMNKIIAYRDATDRYLSKVGRGLELSMKADLDVEIMMLQSLISHIVVGTWRDFSDLKKISGPCDKAKQALARDCKLMEKVMQMVKVSIKVDSNRDQKKSDDNQSPLDLALSHAWTALRLMFLGFPENEEYFAQQKFDDKVDDRTENRWIGLTIIQAARSTDAAECLTALISNNAKLLEKYVDQKMINKLLELIRDRGPYASLMRYFVEMCSCNGVQISSNQELVLNELYLHPKLNQQILIAHRTLEDSDGNHRATHKGWETQGKVKVQIPENFLGMDLWTMGAKQVYVSWTGRDHWEAGSEDLYYSPGLLGIYSRQEKIVTRKDSLVEGRLVEKVFERDESLVRIEDLCWVLDPQKLKMKVLKEEWVDTSGYLEGMDNSKITQDTEERKMQLLKEHKVFEKHKNLAAYLEAQIDLYAEMALNRSYNVIGVLRKEFPFSMLVCVVANESLPACIRASYTNLMYRLWIDVFPHETNCGRNQIPNLVWTFEGLRRVGIKEPDALPHFKLLGANSNNVQDSESFEYGYPGPDKFFLLQQFIASFLDKLKGFQDIDDTAQSIFTKQIVQLVKDLISFGFYHTFDGIIRVTKPLIEILDGTRDVFGNGGYDDTRIKSRYEMSHRTGLVMSCRQTICETLLQVCDLRANYCLGQILAVFKEQHEKAINDHMDMSRFTVSSNIFDIDTPAEHVAERAFAEMFDKRKDGGALDLDRISDSKIDNIILDMLLYECNDLFDAALRLLQRKHSKCASFLECLEEVKIVSSTDVPVYSKFENLDSEISLLRFYVNSSETWAVANEYSGIDESIFENLYQIFDKIIKFLLWRDPDSGEVEEKDGTSSHAYSTHSGEIEGLRGCPQEDFGSLISKPIDAHNQDLMYFLGLHKILYSAILDSQESMHDVVVSAVGCLSMLAKHNAGVQRETFQHIHKLIATHCANPHLGISRLILEVVRGNAELCYDFDELIFGDFTDALLNSGSHLQLLEFCLLLINPSDGTIPRNQSMTMGLFLKPSFKTFVDADIGLLSQVDLLDEQDKKYELALLLQTFIECTKCENISATGRLQELFGIDESLSLISKLLSKEASSAADERLLCCSISYLDHVFLDTPLKDPNLVHKQSLFDGLKRLNAALSNMEAKGQLNTTSLDRGVVDIAVNTLACIKSFFDFFHMLNRPPEIKSEIAETLKQLLVDEDKVIEIRRIASDTLHTFDHVDKSVGKLSEKLQFQSTTEHGKNVNRQSRDIQHAYMKFVMMIQKSEQVEKRIKAEEFELVDLLEQIDRCQNDDGDDESQTGDTFLDRYFDSIEEKLDDVVNPLVDQLANATTTVLSVSQELTFDRLVKRMLKFVHASFGVKEKQESCCIVFQTLILYLHRACNEVERAYEYTGSDWKEKRQEALLAHSTKQNRLNKLGLSATVYEAVMYSDAKSKLFVKALELGEQLVMYGNLSGQDSLLEFAKKDTHGKFFRNIRDALRGSIDGIKSAQKMQKQNQMNLLSLPLLYENAKFVLGFLQQLCEGHNLHWQQALREQTFLNVSYDLVEEGVLFLEVIAKNQLVVRHLGDNEMEVLCATLDFLVEVMQGPCSENQEFVATSTAIDASKMLLSNNTFSRLEDKSLKYTMRAKSILLLSSCLEGRNDDKVHKVLATKLEQRLLDTAVVRLQDTLKAFEDKDSEVSHDLDNLASEMDVDELQSFIAENVDNAALCLITVMTKLKSFFEKSEESTSKEKQHAVEDDTAVSDALKNFYQRLCSVEIWWQDHIEVVMFPLPEESVSLSKGTKEHFTSTANTDNQDTRIKAFVEGQAEILDEMKVLHALKDARIYKFVDDNLTKIEQANFFLALMLNLLMLIGVTGSTVFPSDTRSVTCTLVLILMAIVSIFSRSLVIFYHVRSQSELIWRKYTREAKQAKRNTFTVGPLGNWFVMMIGYCIVCVVHAIGSAEIGEAFKKYLTVGSLLAGVSFVIQFRKCLIIPRLLFLRFYKTIYDVLMKTQIATNIVLSVCLILGFYRVFFFSFVLCDVIMLFEDLQNTVRAVIKPAKSLALTGFLFIVMVLIFSSIGFTVYGEDQFCEDDCNFNDNPMGPDSLKNSFWLILSVIRFGDIGEVMQDINHEDPQYVERILFMLAFFIILGVLLFNMVTGVILDTFSSLREESEVKSDTLRDENFLSGITRKTYDDKNLDFEKLQDIDQNLWNYFYFLLYLDKKDSSEYTGSEQYVANCIEVDDRTWIPERTSAELLQCSADMAEDSSDKKIEVLNSKVDQLVIMFGELSAKVEQLISNQYQIGK